MRQRRQIQRDRSVLLAELLSPESRCAVVGWLARLGVPDRDSEDVAQVVVFGAYRGFHTFDPARCTLERWLNRITVYQASHYRQQARHWREELRDELDAPAELDVEELLDEVELRARLYVTAAALPPEERRVLEGVDLDGCTVRDVARQTGTKERSAYLLRWRAIATVGEQLRSARRVTRARRRP